MFNPSIPIGDTRRSAASALDDIAVAVGRGLVAGAVGTAAMTVSSTLEMKLRGRESSSAPADAAGKVLGVGPRDERGAARFSNAVHWLYGTSWGAARGVLAVAGVDGPRASVAHFGIVWGAELATLPALGVAPAPWKWGAQELGVDALHHGVYATVAGLAYSILEP